MTAVNVVLLQPPGYAHSLALLEVGRLLTHSLRSLGRLSDLRINETTQGDLNVLLGYHLLEGSPALSGVDFVVYQLEQLSRGEGWFLPWHLELFRRARAVWDYSPENVAFLREQGLTNVCLLPIGFHEALFTIRPRAEEIDVVFYGSVNRRRQEVLDDLARTHRVEALYGIYGRSRDAYVARSKIALNVHFYESQIIEQVRISYLLNNRRFVISEPSPKNPYEGGFVTGARHELGGLCRQYLLDRRGRAAIAERGFELFRQRPMVDYLRRVL
jgi:hypothetical protein